MQISRLIKCRGRAVPPYLNIVAYSLFLAEGGKEKRAEARLAPGIRTKEAGERGVGAREGGRAPKLGRRELSPIPSLMHDSAAVSHFIWVPVRRR